MSHYSFKTTLTANHEKHSFRDGSGCEVASFCFISYSPSRPPPQRSLVLDACMMLVPHGSELYDDGTEDYRNRYDYCAGGPPPPEPELSNVAADEWNAFRDLGETLDNLDARETRSGVPYQRRDEGKLHDRPLSAAEKLPGDG